MLRKGISFKPVLVKRLAISFKSRTERDTGGDDSKERKR